MASTTAEAASTPRLTSSGVARLITVFATLVVEAALFFGGAGSLALPRGWAYYGGLLAYMLSAVAVLLVRFPGVIEIVNERGKLNKAGVKRWDKAFQGAYVGLLIITPVLAGLDAGRFHWSAAPAPVAAPALVVSALAYTFVYWAMAVNRFAETGVRVQVDRGQVVVSSGPYGLVRHPFYAAAIVIQLAYPPAVGSLYAFLPALATAGLFVWRTAREDATLRAELPGYLEYAARVRYRLLPGVW
ncbi:MAG TPA: isoprenylcysteine carboxylmethyltransferase family protein [Polyangia bacterium]|jgi:protein-S-isoprenylcysteine O-methyltransferase Ste14